MGVLSIALVFTIGLVSYPSEVSAAWGFSSSGSDPGKVLLRDVQVNKKNKLIFIAFLMHVQSIYR